MFARVRLIDLSSPEDYGAVVCNGEIEPSQADTIRKCWAIAAVDGGMNHCRNLGLNPVVCVGDFDSAEEPSGIKTVRLQRAKDETDLEVALKHVRVHSIVFGGFGHRIDHTLTNLFIAFRYPGQLLFESERQVFFTFDAEKTTEVLPGRFQTLSLIPLNGPASQITFHSEKETINYATITRENYPKRLPITGPFSLHVREGMLAALLETEALPPNTDATFALCRPLLDILRDLFACNSPLHADQCSVHRITPDLGIVRFPSRPDQVVSLIPFYGPVSGVQIQGLRWTCDHFDHNFVGLSNLCLGEEFSVSVKSGELFCVILDFVHFSERVS